MRKKELLVGVFSIVVIALLYFGFYFLKGINLFSTTSKYYIIYDNVDRLAVSNQVKVNGVVVGRVSDVQIMENKALTVFVEIDIDSKIKLGDSTKAILDSELLGGNFIVLSIGPVSKPLDPGDTLRSELAEGMLDMLSKSAEPVAANVQTTLRKLNTVLESLNKNSQRLDSIFAKLQTTPDHLNRTLVNANGKMDIIATSISEANAQLKATMADLRPVLKNFEIFSDSLKRLELNKTMAKTQKALDGMNETLAKLRKGDNTASKLLTEDSLYVNLNKLLKNLDSLANHFDENPKHFMAPLGKSKKKVDKDRKAAEEKKAQEKK